MFDNMHSFIVKQYKMLSLAIFLIYNVIRYTYFPKDLN